MNSNPSPGHKATINPSLLGKGIVSVTGSAYKIIGTCGITISIPPNPPSITSCYSRPIYFVPPITTGIGICKITAVSVKKNDTSVFPR